MTKILKGKLLLITLITIALTNCSSDRGKSQPQYQQQYQQQYAPPQPSYYAPPPQRYANPYQYQQAGSRFYSNPYAIAPQNQYPYYDGDQYYVPPTYYGVPDYDSSPNSSFNQKF